MRARERLTERTRLRKRFQSVCGYLDRACVRDAFFRLLLFAIVLSDMLARVRARSLVWIGSERKRKFAENFSVSRDVLNDTVFSVCFLFALFTNSFFLSVFLFFTRFVLNVRYFFLFNLSFDMHKIVLTLTSSACVYVCLWFCVLACFILLFHLRVEPKKKRLKLTSVPCFYCVLSIREKKGCFKVNFRRKNSIFMKKRIFYQILRIFTLNNVTPRGESAN